MAHGETVRETANMISFMAEVIGIRDDMYLGEGNAYMREVARRAGGIEGGVLHQRPSVVNLQCDVDHPTQTMADLVASEGALRLTRGAARQEDSNELGVFAELRQAAVRAAGDHRPVDASA
jgi:ornithine carbamoyltransferase